MHNHTKIVATIADINCGVLFLRELFNAGLDVVRINTAHATEAGALKIITNVRKVSDKIAILIDTKGPEIRTTACEAKIPVKKGEKIIMSGNPNCRMAQGCVCVNYKGFVRDTPVGARIMIDDGHLELIVRDKNRKGLVCEVMNDGVIHGKKGVNLPGVRNHLPAVSDKDKKFIRFAVKHKVDFIGHSFVRNKKDVKEVQKLLDAKKNPIKIIAKIENQEGVENIDNILKHVYGVMVARGDLGIEVSEEKIPGIQKMLIKKCIQQKKPVIVATQMLHSMIKNPRPTRAEVSDVANAVYDGTDAIMLSGETAIGKYPVSSEKTMVRIAKEVEAVKLAEHELDIIPINNETSAFLAKAAVNATLTLPTRAIIADTQTGRTARYLAAFRGRTPVYIKCYDKMVMRLLALSYGVYPDFMKPRKTTDAFLSFALSPLLKSKRLRKKDRVLILAGSFGPSAGASYIEISTVKNLLRTD